MTDLLVIVFPEMTIPSTVASEEIDPIEIPCPPVHELPVNAMFDPLFYRPNNKSESLRYIAKGAC